jgi:hypothetical protein
MFRVAWPLDPRPPREIGEAPLGSLICEPGGADNAGGSEAGAGCAVQRRTLCLSFKVPEWDHEGSASTLLSWNMKSAGLMRSQAKVLSWFPALYCVLRCPLGSDMGGRTICAVAPANPAKPLSDQQMFGCLTRLSCIA